jgi:hypothetical protein
MMHQWMDEGRNRGRVRTPRIKQHEALVLTYEEFPTAFSSKSKKRKGIHINFVGRVGAAGVVTHVKQRVHLVPRTRSRSMQQVNHV